MTKQSAHAEDEAAPGEGTAPGAEQTPLAGAAKTAPEADPAALAAEFKDRHLRTLAEMENLRRRTEREAADARTYAVTAFARDMLNVVDNLTRALESLPENARSAGDDVLKSLIDGVELTARDLSAALARHGVKKQEPQGEKFDPNFHQAMFEMPDETLPAGTVTKVVQSGWTIGERVLRPAMVGVSKGGPKPVKAE
jgi:molecular chaperone GrpE